MELRYDEELIESALLAVIEKPPPHIHPRQIARFHRKRERLYDLLDPEERNEAFFRLHREWFREWELENQLLKRLAEFPILECSLEVLAFRKARNGMDEGAELYAFREKASAEPAVHRHGVVAVRPQRFRCSSTLAVFLRHELMHLHDMLDPAFGYDPEADKHLTLAPQRRLAGERYRVLWDLSIDARLERAGYEPPRRRQDHRCEFDAAFAFWEEPHREEWFDRLWSDPAPSHAQLWRLASDPRGLAQTAAPVPGAPCPLCHMPTHAWRLSEHMTEAVRAEIQQEFPSWTPEMGLCNRCLEAYEVKLKYASWGVDPVGSS